MATRFKESELLKGLNAYTTHADELAEPLELELLPLEKLRSSVKKYDRPTDPVWDEFFDCDGVSEDFMPDRGLPSNGGKDD